MAMPTLTLGQICCGYKALREAQLSQRSWTTIHEMSLRTDSHKNVLNCHFTNEYIVFVHFLHTFFCFLSWYCINVNKHSTYQSSTYMTPFTRPMPRPRRGGCIIKWVVVSVRPSVCRVPSPNSRTDRPYKAQNIGKMEAHHTINLWTYLEVKTSKVNVTRPVNAVTESASYLPNGKRHDIQGQRSRSRCHMVHLTWVGP